ncbi:MAG: DNA-binding protein [Spirochaetes bacterium]|nr:DNA-binding protein [Spirochaetota bacterium]MBN2772544.1 DNA-binding protein [Spirochaetota bacterium]
MNQSEIILYKTEDGTVKIDTIFQNQTIWLTQSTMAELFDVNVPAISKHLKNIFEDKELQKEATISKMETVQNNNINIGSRSGGCIRWVKNKKSSCL